LIKVEVIEEVKNRGAFKYRVEGMPIVGQSRQPLIDACRQIKALLGTTDRRAGLFREGRAEPDISCSVSWGAAHTVDERNAGGIRFVKYREPDTSLMAEAAE
jgi:hypothetical protein